MARGARFDARQFIPIISRPPKDSDHTETGEMRNDTRITAVHARGPHTGNMTLRSSAQRNALAGEAPLRQSKHARPWLVFTLSSGLAATLIALLGTLIGLMYRLGALSTFNIDADLFIPESALELTYWGYMTALSFWGRLYKFLSLHFVEHLTASAFYGLIFLIVLVAVSRTKNFSESAQKRMLAIVQKPWALQSLAASAVFFLIALIPWVFAFLLAFAITLPLAGYSLGQRDARMGLKEYQAQIGSATRECHRLTRANEKFGSCPYVIAQTRLRIAYLDDETVHIIPSDGVRVEWSLPKK